MAKFAAGNYVTSAGDKKSATPGGTFRIRQVSAYGGRGTVYQVEDVNNPGHVFLVDEGFLSLAADQTDSHHGMSKL